MYILLYAASDLLPEEVVVLIYLAICEELAAFIVTVRQATQTVKTEEMEMISLTCVYALFLCMYFCALNFSHKKVNYNTHQYVMFSNCRNLCILCA